MKVSFKLFEIINRFIKKVKDLFHYFRMNFVEAVRFSPETIYIKNTKKRGRFPIAANGI